MTNSDKLVGANGMTIQGIAAATGLNVSYFVSREATTCTVCSGVDANGNAVDFLTVHNWGTLVAGDECIPPTGSVIQNITLTAGSIKRF